MTAADRLNEIDQRAQAATPGPWLHCYPGQCCQERCIESQHEHDAVIHSADDLERRDATFIAAAREDVPALVSALRAVLAENAQMRTWSRKNHTSLFDLDPTSTDYLAARVYADAYGEAARRLDAAIESALGGTR